MKNSSTPISTRKKDGFNLSELLGKNDNFMFAISKGKLNRKDRLIRWGILGLSSITLAGTFLAGQGYTIHLLGCPFRAMTGIPCPTCGMTRSFTAIARGYFSEAMVYHLFGPLVFFSLLILWIQAILELYTNSKITTALARIYQNQIIQVLGIIAYFSYYSVRLYLLSKYANMDINMSLSDFPHWIKIW